MRKSILLLLVLTLAMGVFVSCGSNDEEPVEEEDVVVEETEEETEEEETEVTDGEIMKLGLGQTVSLSGTDAEGEDTASGQINVTMAALGLDADDKIASVTIDTVQGKVDFDEDLAIDYDEEVLTKKELKEDYGMKDISEIDKEWYEQMEAFEDWMIGKTVDEVLNLEVFERDENHQHVPAEEDLTSTVTITVEGYLAALEDAANNLIDVEGAETVGLGVEPSLAKSNGLDGDKAPKIQFDVTYAAFAFNGEEVVDSIVDVVQPTVEFDEAGVVVSDLEEEVLSKKELKEDYGMKKISEIEKEWYEQMEAFEEWMMGKTMDEIQDIEVFERDEAHTHVPADEDLTSSVTITVDGYLAAAEKAEANKK